MSKLLFLIFFSALFSNNLGDCVRILGIIPTPSISHQLPFRPLWKELSLRGHQVTVITTDPLKDPSLTNLTELDMGFSYEILEKYNFSAVLSDESKSFLEMAKMIRDLTVESSEAQINTPELQELLHNKDITFDLIITESQLPAMLGFVWRFKCPWIGVASLDAGMQFHDSAGNPTHPISTPDHNLPIENPENLKFIDRVVSVLFWLFFRYKIYNDYYPFETERMRKYFGKDMPPLMEIQNNISMLFVSTNPVFYNPRPLNPNTITIGSGMHILPPKPLPQNLQSYLDSAKEGVIYFSLGSNIKGNLLNETTRGEIMNALAEVPYKVLLKFDDKLTYVPPNVMVETWFPQQDVLRHPNIILFVSQGGLQSLQESLLNHIPLIGIPFYGDQMQNVQKMILKGFGVKIDKKNITRESLKSAILEVTNNPMYREMAKKYGEILADEPMTSLEKAVWWVEYVIRHKGAKHFKSTATKLTLIEFYMLDVIAFILGLFITTLAVLVISFRLVRYILKLLLTKKVKRKTL